MRTAIIVLFVLEPGRAPLPGLAWVGDPRAPSLHKGPDRQDQEHPAQRQVEQPGGVRDIGMFRSGGRFEDELSERTQHADQRDCRSGVHRMTARRTTAQADESGEDEQHTEDRGDEGGRAGTGTGSRVRPTADHDQDDPDGNRDLGQGN